MAAIDETATKRWRWGICGVGKISSDFCTALVHTPNATLTAVAAGSSIERATAFAATFNEMQLGVTPGLKAVEAHESYEKLAERSDLDIVYVGTVNTTHYDTAMLLINSGKNVLIEKPIGVNTNEAKALAAAAAEKKVFLMEGMWTRFFPSCEKAKEVVASGEIGRVVAVHADFGFRCDDEPSSRMFDLNLAGGGLLDIGIYPLAFVSMAYGGAMPTSIKAVGSLHGTTGVDTSAGITCLYQSAIASDSQEAGGPEQPGIAVVTYNLRGFTPEDVLIVGTEGRVLIKGPAHTSTQVVVTKPNGRDGVSEKVFDFPLPDIKQSFNYPNSQGFVYEIAEVQNCLAQNKLECDKYSHQEMLNISSTMHEIRSQLGVVYPSDKARS